MAATLTVDNTIPFQSIVQGLVGVHAFSFKQEGAFTEHHTFAVAQNAKMDYAKMELEQ